MHAHNLYSPARPAAPAGRIASARLPVGLADFLVVVGARAGLTVAFFAAARTGGTDTIGLAPTPFFGGTAVSLLLDLDGPVPDAPPPPRPSPRFIRLAGVIGVTPFTFPLAFGTGGGGMIWLRSTGEGVEVVDGPFVPLVWSCFWCCATPRWSIIDGGKWPIPPMTGCCPLKAMGEDGTEPDMPR
jgi:hypothetical protein